MSSTPAVSPVGAGHGIKFIAFEMGTARTAFSGAAKYAYMIYKISSLHYDTGNRYLFMCFDSILKVSSIECIPATLSSLP